MTLRGSVNCLPAGAQVGEYRLERVIGEGGFGIVYCARDLSLDRVVAIKEYLPSTMAGRGASREVVVRSQHKGAFDAGLRSFINEARLLAKFSHPSLVHVYRFFEANATAYMVMHFYEGQTLRSFLDGKSKVTQSWLTSLLTPLFDALEMLHAADCFHRDIAPDNIFLSTSGVPVLLDFGAARRIIGDMTQALTMVLKPGFAPIEQYVDDGTMPQGAWTDIYQLGAVIYQAITGTAPATAVARMIKDPQVLLTPKTHPAFDAHFLAGVHAALQVHGKDRPQTIVDFRKALGLQPSTVSGQSNWSDSFTATEKATISRSRAPMVSGSGTASPATGAKEPQKSGPTREQAPAYPSQQILMQETAQGRGTNERNGSKRGVTWRVAILSLVVVGGMALWWHHSDLVWPPSVTRAHSPEATSEPPERTQQSELPKTLPAATSVAAPTSVPLEAQGTSPTTPAPNLTAPINAVSLPPVAKQETLPPTQSIAQSPGASAASRPLALIEKGKIILKVLPWGRISVNKRYVGISPPLNQLELPIGRYAIEISNPAGTTVTSMVQVEKEKPVVVQQVFELAP